MKKILSLSLLVCLSINKAFAADQIPDGWSKGGHGPDDDYRVGIDSDDCFSPPRCYFIQSKVPNPEANKNGTLVQKIDATDYRGQRLRMTAYVRSIYPNKEGNTSYFYISGHASKEIYKWVSRDKGWHQVQLVFDVDPDANYITYGISLWGLGILWVDDIALEIVDKNVRLDPQPKVSKPTNLP